MDELTNRRDASPSSPGDSIAQNPLNDEPDTLPKVPASRASDHQPASAQSPTNGDGEDTAPRRATMAPSNDSNDSYDSVFSPDAPHANGTYLGARGPLGADTGESLAVETDGSEYATREADAPTPTYA